MSEDCKAFFEDLKKYYDRENRDMSWKWEDLSLISDSRLILSYLAFNLSKNVLHGPLPEHLHNRMALDANQFSKAYFEYLGNP